MVLRTLNVPNDLQHLEPDPLPERSWRAARARRSRVGAHAPRAVGAATCASRIRRETGAPRNGPDFT